MASSSERHFDRKLWGWWVLASILGMVPLGLGLGLTQWLVLRKRFRRAGWWVLATAGGQVGGGIVLAFGGVLSYVGYDYLQEVLVVVLVSTLSGVMAGAILGLAQWLVLRRWVRRAGWWILVTAACGMAVSLLLIGSTIGGRELVWGGLFLLVVGSAMATGALLARLVGPGGAAMPRCPNCGHTLSPMEVFCSACAFTCGPADWQEWQQVQYLLAEVRSWEWLPATTRAEIAAPYEARLSALRERLGLVSAPSLPRKAPPPRTAPQPPPRPAEAVPSPPEAPFDQWLLSERNIRLLLYGGAVLFVIAAAIFVATQWERMSPPLKFSIVFFLNGGIYLLGYLFWSNRAMRLAGTVLLAVASAFVPLNAVVLYSGILAPRGVSALLTWLVASLFCLLLYALLAFWTRSWVFAALSLAGLVSVVCSALAFAASPLRVWLLTLVAVGFLLLVLARGLRRVPESGFVRQPVRWTIHLAMPVLLLVVAGRAVEAADILASPYKPSRWLLSSLKADLGFSFLSLLLGAGFYLLTDLGKGLTGLWRGLTERSPWRLLPRYLAPLFLALALYAGFTTLRSPGGETGTQELAVRLIFMLLAAGYLWLGARLRWHTGDLFEGLPLFCNGYLLPLVVTLTTVERGVVDLAIVLLAGVALLALSAQLQRAYGWVYGAAWLFLLPFYLLLAHYVPLLHIRGGYMAILALNYALAGYALGRVRGLFYGGPFLSAAVLLSVLVPVLTAASPALTTVVLLLGALFYLGMALWRRWPWALLPATVWLDVALAPLLGVFLGDPSLFPVGLAFAYMGMTLALAGAGLAVERRAGLAWAWPVYTIAGFTLLFAYAFALTETVPAIILSVVFAGLLLCWSWLYRRYETWGPLPGSFCTYAGLLFLVVGHLYGTDLLDAWEVWPVIGAGLCGLLLGVSWLLRRASGDVRRLYRQPLRRSGLVLFWFAPLVALVRGGMGEGWSLLAVVLGMVALFCGLEGLLERRPLLGYLTGGALVGAYWGLLGTVGVTEVQAYLLPPGLVCLVGGLALRRRGHLWAYRLLCWIPLGVLLGSSFVQSLWPRGLPYLVLVLVESLLAFFGGMRLRSRVFVVVGFVTLLLVAVVQLWEEVVAWRFLLLSFVGALLLTLGILALYRREQMLRAGRFVADTWKAWDL